MRNLSALFLSVLLASSGAFAQEADPVAAEDQATGAAPSADNGAEAPEGPVVPEATGTVATRSAVPAQLRLRGATTLVAPLRSVARPRERVAPVPPITGGPGPDTDPEQEARSAYDPLGLRIGSFVLNSTSRTAVGFSTNVDGSSEGDDAAYVDGQGEVTLKSDWEVHSLDLTLRGGLRDYYFTDQSSDPNGEVRLNGRLDLTEVDQIALGAAYDWSREDSSDFESSGGSADVHTFSFSSGYQRRAGLIGLDLKGAVDRTIYEEGDDRDETVLTSALRLSLDSGAALEPFVEVGALGRLRDETRDTDGYRRSSVGGEAKVGVAVDSGLVTGELAAGYALEHFEDDRLDDLRGVLVEGSLAWAPTRLTTVTLTADTAFEPTRLAGASGSITRSVDLLTEYALRPNLILGLGGTLSYQTYTGADRTVTTASVRAGAAYKLNRNVELGVTATHSVEDVNTAGGDNRETTVEAAVTFRQ